MNWKWAHSELVIIWILNYQDLLLFGHEFSYQDDKNRNSGVYKLLYGSCPRYKLETGLSFELEQQEHYRSSIKEKRDSNYVHHC